VDIGEGRDSILTYEPLTLSATEGYPSYLWQDGSTETEYYISAPSAGLYTVSVTAENGCVTRDSVFVAYDQPDLVLSQIASPVSSCSLEADHQPSLEVLNNGFYRISTSDTIVINYVVNGEYSVIEAVQLESVLPPGESTILTFQEGYDFSAIGTYQLQASIIWSGDDNPSNNLLSGEVHVWEPPEVEIGGGEDTLRGELPLTLDAGTTFSTYVWQDNSTQSTFEVRENGQYWVEVSDDHGCTARDSVHVVSITSSPEDLFLKDQIRIYPNPASEVVFVTLELEEEQEVVLELYSITNALVLRKEFRKIRDLETRIQVEDLTPGTYFIRLSLDQKPYNSLLIIE
jgi:hypothetical protein